MIFSQGSGTVIFISFGSVTQAEDTPYVLNVTEHPLSQRLAVKLESGSIPSYSKRVRVDYMGMHDGEERTHNLPHSRPLGTLRQLFSGQSHLGLQGRSQLDLEKVKWQIQLRYKHRNYDKAYTLQSLNVTFINGKQHGFANTLHSYSPTMCAAV